jgi:hypothetical protein
MKKIFNQKSFNFLVWSPFGCRVNMTPVANLLQVLLTHGNLPPLSLTPAEYLPLVSLIPVVHLDLRISPRISTDPNIIFRSLGGR